MDQELRDALNDLKQDNREGVKEVKNAIECLRTDYFNHCMESVERYGVTNASTRSAHHRLDEIVAAKQSGATNRWAMWVAVVSSALAFGGAAVLLYLQLSHGGIK